MAFRDPWHGIVGGGDLDPADQQCGDGDVSMAAKPGAYECAPHDGAIFG